MNESTEKPKNENLSVGQNSGHYENSCNNGNTNDYYNNSVSSRNIRSLKRSITNTAPANRKWFHPGTVKPVEELHSETFHSRNTTLPFYKADTNNIDRFYGSSRTKQCINSINHNSQHQNMSVDYRLNVPPPPKNNTYIDNNGRTLEGVITHVYNGNDGTFGSKHYDHRGNGTPFYNASFISSTNNMLNMNTGENCNPYINSDITRNVQPSGEIIYRPSVGFQQQNIQIGESNNAFSRSSQVDENKLSVNGTTIPLCKNGNTPLHFSDTFQGNTYDVHRSVQQMPIQMNRNYLTSQPGIPPGMQLGIPPGMQLGIPPGIPPGLQLGIQTRIPPPIQIGIPPTIQSTIQPTIQPTSYKQMNVQKMHNCGENKIMNSNVANTIRNPIQNNSMLLKHLHNKSNKRNQNLKGMTNSFLSGNDMEKRSLQLLGNGNTSLINSSNKNAPNYPVQQIHNRSNSLVQSRKGHRSYFTNYKDTHQKDSNTNYSNSQIQHNIQGEQNTFITNNRTKSNDEKLLKSSKIDEYDAPPTNENQGTEIMKEKKKTVFCKVCMIHIKSTAYEKHEKTEHVKCPLDNCNEVYNVNDYEYHLLRHVKKENSNKSILEDPEEIKKWIEERKKNYPLQKNRQNQTNSDETQQETADNRVSKKLKKPKCLIEELLFENYCTAIGKHIVHKKKNNKSIFVPLFTQMENNNYPDIYGKEYYNYFEDSEETNYTNDFKQQNKNVHSNNNNSKCHKIIESLNIHKTPPLLYQLLRDDIMEYEQKLMSCITYITENNFFDTDEEKDIEELK